MNRPQRTGLYDVSIAYTQAKERYDQYARRGDYDRADEALDDMKRIERCVSVHETSTEWRNRPRRERHQ